MTKGPLPPHERPWRHPSELAAAPLETPTRSGRLLIISTATVSLLLVGVLAVTMTPGRSRSPQALVDSTVVSIVSFNVAAAGSEPDASATTVVNPPSPSAPATTTAVAGDPAAGDRLGEGNPLPPATVAATHEVAPVPTTSTFSGPAPLTTGSVGVLVTPVGDGLAVTTQDALGADPATLDEVVPMTAELPSGSVVEVDVVATSGDLVIVAIMTGATSEDRALAGELSAAPELVEQFVVVGGTTARFDASAFPPSDLPEGAPIVDADGRLLGLCTHGPDGVEMLAVSSLPELPVPATSEPSVATSEPLPDSTVPATTVPVTTSTTIDPAAPTVPATTLDPAAATSTVAAVTKRA